MTAHRIGIERTLMLMSLTLLAAALLALPLPTGRAPHTPARASEIGTSESPGTDVAR